jgi:hypothetical protein
MNTLIHTKQLKHSNTKHTAAAAAAAAKCQASKDKPTATRPASHFNSLRVGQY